MTETEITTIQRLDGGRRWHCQDVSCSYVTSADLDLSGPSRDVRWDDEDKALRPVDDPGETLGLSNVCNECRQEKGWESFWSLSNSD